MIQNFVEPKLKKSALNIMSIFFSNYSIQVIIYFRRAVEFGNAVTLIVTLLSQVFNLVVL